MVIVYVIILRNNRFGAVLGNEIGLYEKICDLVMPVLHKIFKEVKIHEKKN